MKLSHELAYVRPEGGAVRLTFGMDAEVKEVRVLRVPAGAIVTGPDDPQATVVFYGTPARGEAFYRFERNSSEDDPRGEVWDLEAYADSFGDSENRIDGSRWDYHLFPRGEYTWGEPVVLKVDCRRTAQAELMLDVKALVYSRARYHGLSKGVFAIKQESLHDRAPPIIQVKARHTLTEVFLGEEDDGEGSIVTATFRAVAEARLLASSPAERDTLGDFFTSRLLGDLNLFGALGWDGLGLSTSDSMVDLGAALLYTREITLDGLVDAAVRREHTLSLRAPVFSFRAELDIDE